VKFSEQTLKLRKIILVCNGFSAFKTTATSTSSVALHEVIGIQVAEVKSLYIAIVYDP